MSNMHVDFQRIHAEFTNYYCKSKTTCDEGDKEFDEWIKDLELDITKAYGEFKEAFVWAQDMITRLREDESSVYYKVLLGLPLTSMNGNIYTETELKKAVKTAVGIRIDMNHRDDKILPAECTFVGAEYEDGAAETILRVPKDLVCPVCEKGMTIVEMIDEKLIVNVSLQASCGSRPTARTCGDMKFTRCALLTKKTLPGIPLSRIKPLEGVLTEAFNRPREGPKGVHVQVVGMGSVSEPFRYPVKPGPRVLPDGQFQCPPGWSYSADRQECLPCDCPPGQMHDPVTMDCVPIPKAPPEGTKVVVGKNVGDDSHKPVVEAANLELEGAETLLRDYKNNAKILEQEEKILYYEKVLADKITALLTVQGQLKTLESTSGDERDRLTGVNDGLRTTIRELDEKIARAKISYEDLVDSSQKRLKEQTDQITKSRDGFRTQAGNLSEMLEEVTGKYEKTIETNLLLTKKLTDATEEIVTVSKERDEFQSRLGKVKTRARAIAKI